MCMCMSKWIGLHISSDSVWNPNMLLAKCLAGTVAEEETSKAEDIVTPLFHLQLVFTELFFFCHGCMFVLSQPALFQISSVFFSSLSLPLSPRCSLIKSLCRQI